MVEGRLPPEIYERVGSPIEYDRPDRHDLILELIYDGAPQRALDRKKIGRKPYVRERDLEVLGLYVYTNLTLEEVAKATGYFTTRERTRQVIKKTLSILYKESSPELKEKYEDVFKELLITRKKSSAKHGDVESLKRVQNGLAAKVYELLNDGVEIDSIIENLGLNAYQLNQIRIGFALRDIDLPYSSLGQKIIEGKNKHQLTEQMFDKANEVPLDPNIQSIKDDPSYETVCIAMSLVDRSYYYQQIAKDDEAARHVIAISHISENLYRVHRHSNSVVDSLKKVGIPVVSLDHGGRKSKPRNIYLIPSRYVNFAKNILENDTNLAYLNSNPIDLISKIDRELPTSYELRNGGQFISLRAALEPVGVALYGRYLKVKASELFGEKSGCEIAVFRYKNVKGGKLVNNYFVDKNDIEAIQEFTLNRLRQLKQ